MGLRLRAYLGRVRGQLATGALEPLHGSLRSFSHELPDGARTTVHVAAYPARETHVRLEAMAAPLPLSSWCEETGARNALVGGFFVRNGSNTPLGELWLRGSRMPSVPFDEPWGSTRSCVAIDGGRVRLAPRDDLQVQPLGDLLQAGPLLVVG